MNNGNNRATTKTAGKGLKSEPNIPMSFQSIISDSALHKYGLRYLETVTVSPQQSFL